MTDRKDEELNLLLGKLTLEEKVSLLAAVDWWRTPTIKREGVFVPHIKTTDGPNGARGESYVSGIRAACFPCGTSLGASFDREQLYRVGKEIALEAKSKSASVLLGPTLNMIRDQRGGRNYETYSEDPVVLGVLTAAFINGCQSEGIAATPKHYVANDTENKRTVLTVEIDEQALREIYMLPFQIAMKLSDPWCFMTSYNRVNGTYVADSDRLVNGVLRKEWGFQGLVVSDWMGVYSTADGINAGVDVEMPGPTDWRADKLVKAVENGLVSTATIDESALRVLKLAKRLGRFEDPEEPPEQEAENEERDTFIRKAGAEGMVLLKNENDVLPLSKDFSVALIGHHATHASLGGGGSARVDAIRAVSPAEGFKAAGYNTTVAPGVPVYGALPHADASIIFDTATKQQCAQPVQIEWFNGHKVGEGLAHAERKPLPEYMIKEKWPEYLSREYCTRITFNICPTTSGEHVLSIISTGPAACYVDGREIYGQGQEKNLRPESFYFFKSKIERRVRYPMEAGRQYTLVLESWNTDPEVLNAPPLNGKMFQGSALRFQEFVDVQQRIEEAVNAAKAADVAIVCTGTTSEIESEGFDRESTALTAGQVDQVLAIAAANPRTVLVNFSGAAVDLSALVDKVPAIVQGWFPGQEGGHSLALALGGEIGPSGRLPFSWPRRDEDNSSWGNFPCDSDNVVRYEEGLSVGYRYFDQPGSPAPLFPFGFGLSYTTFELLNLHSAKDTFRWTHDSAAVAVDVRNVGTRSGSAVLQFYVEMPREDNGDSTARGRGRPIKELKDFQKIHDIRPGESRRVTASLDKYAFSIYNAEEARWQVKPGTYKVHAGFSSQDLVGFTEVSVRTTMFWDGV